MVCKGKEAQFQKVKLQAEQTAHFRPVVRLENKECLATYVKVGDCKVWALWDSGSMMMGITPSYAEAANARVFLLKDPHMLQLGMIGSHALVNYGLNVLVKAPGIKGETYVDVANFNHYNMIIYTPFMRNNKVKLDFEHNIVIVNGEVTPAHLVVLDSNDGQLCWYRLTNKWWEWLSGPTHKATVEEMMNEQTLGHDCQKEWTHS